ncbi:MerR family transcriptional regulator [Aquamicrobium sp. NLF2-7]|uniref:helix-turn-helix domain-containing protein n=1 Tax=Aquamicrobium sp. NLF2-7 TaxID=2918753 RepID=UPI001EFB1689|nr:MerR family transcriptional regulator [Aquamicrobium sp. NLF2-7]MCG8273904.1 MerR family transcriptional regulator [Aquamicrobium sp. NLF2-7]
MNGHSGRMQIGELAERTGVSHRTIHYYERIGLMKPAEREGAGYRYYDDESVKRLEKIAVLKQLGLSLDDIASVIDLYFSDPSGIKGKEKVLQILETQLTKTAIQLGELSSFKCELEANIERMKGLIHSARDT